MTDPTMSRRDWFRLKKRESNRMLTDHRGNTSESVLNPISDPPNHDGMDLSQLPPMTEAELTSEQVGHLINDIRTLGEQVQLMQRSGGPRSRASATRLSIKEQLTATEQALLNQKINRVQIRYQWDGFLWIDTLETQDRGFRLVRIRHEIV